MALLLAPPPAVAAQPLRLTAHVISYMGISSIFAPSDVDPATDARYNGLSFSDSGGSLFGSRNDGVLDVISGETGAPEASYKLKDAGCRLVAATHQEQAVLHASASSLHAPSHVSYHDIFRNTEIRRFVGHTNKITALSMNPEADVFLTCSLDGTFKLWDLRSAAAVASGSFPLPEHDVRASPEPAYPVAAFDCTGKVFGVAIPQRGIACYDASQVTKPRDAWEPKPFFTSKAPLFHWMTVPTRVDPTSTQELPPQYPSTMSFTGMAFSPDEQTLAVCTSDRGVLLLDCFSPHKEMALLAAHPHDSLHSSNIAYSPDGKYLTTGGCDGHVWTYDLSSRPDLFDAEDPNPSPWRPGRWDPPLLLTGGAHKSPTTRQAAMEAGAKRKEEVHAAMRRARQKFAEMLQRPADTLGPPKGVPSLPPLLATTAEEAVSRHDAPVTVVAWHPKAAVLASAARSVAVWTPPSPLPAEPAPAAAPAAAPATSAGGATASAPA